MNKLTTSLKALSDKNRLRILKLLEQKDMCVCELAHIIDIAQPSVSRHLKKLKQAGLITSEQDGSWTNYKLIRKQNDFHIRNILNQTLETLDEENIIQKDLETAKMADRNKLCSS
ncbi:ArsR/SmtB family transcription factor [Thermoproteota archaeon]